MNERKQTAPDRFRDRFDALVIDATKSMRVPIACPDARTAVGYLAGVATPDDVVRIRQAIVNSPKYLQWFLDLASRLRAESNPLPVTDAQKESSQ